MDKKYKNKNTNRYGNNFNKLTHSIHLFFLSISRNKGELYYPVHVH